MPTYYVSNTGNNANAGTSEATAWQTVAKVNSSTFAAGDSILFQRGGVWAEQLIPPSSGAAGNPITFDAYGTGAKPRFNPSATPLSVSSKTNLIIQNLDFYNSSATAGTMAVSLGGTTANVTLKDLAISAVGYGTWSSGAFPGLVIDGWVIDTARHTLQGIELTNTTGPVIKNCTMKRGIYLNTCAGATLANNTSTLSAGRGVRINGCTGTVVIDGLTVTTPSSFGVEFINSTLTNSTVTNVSVSGGSQNGVKVTSSSGIAFSRCGVTNNTSTGAFLVESTSSNVTFTDCTYSGAGTHGFRASGVTNVTYTRCTCVSGGGRGFATDGACSGIAYSACVAMNCGNSGFNAEGSSTNIVYEDCQSRGNRVDGFLSASTANNVTWRRCIAIGNGSKMSTADGDGFTAHDTNYNIRAHYCIAAFNTASGFGMVHTSAGEILNCVAYANGGNWLAANVGVDQVRGGIYIATTGNNATSGTSWTVKNTIGQANYPREIYLTAAAASIVTFNFNRYHESNTAKFATLDGGTTDITWATYATREPNSTNGDPLMTAPASLDFTLQATSPAINTGTSVGLTTDHARNAVPQRGGIDIGAYEYPAPQKEPRIGSSRIRFRSAA